MYYIASFKSRAETLRFKKELDKRNIFAETVPTPKQANIGCGLSVKVNRSHLIFLKKLIYALSFSSFVGFFIVKETKEGKMVSLVQVL